MALRGNPYRDGESGRSIGTVHSSGRAMHVAHLRCSRCPSSGTLTLSKNLPPALIDKKFKEIGWCLDPHVCPTCRAVRTGESRMSAVVPSSAAIKAQAKMFNLLAAHFDPEKGSYRDGWSDEKVASEADMSIKLVVEFRRAGFGELKEPPEVAELRSDVEALSQLCGEQFAALQKEIDAFRIRVADIAKRWTI